MREKITSEDSIIILKKMCEMIGVSYEAVSFIQPNWYELYTWTLEEQEVFIDWLAWFLIDHKYVQPKWKQAVHEAQKINMAYGWRTTKESIEKEIKV